MKVLHIGQLIGGLDVYIRNSITYSSGNIDYVIMHGKQDNSKPIFCKGIEVKEYKTNLQRNVNPFKDAFTLLEAINIILKEKPNIVHCHSAKGGLIGRVAGFLTHTPTLYTPHGFSFLSTSSTIMKCVYRSIERMTRFKSYMLACGESEQKLAEEDIGYSKDRALCWHNCVAD